MNYQIWLTDKQKKIIMRYIQERRYQHMLMIYTNLLLSAFLILYIIWIKIFTSPAEYIPDIERHEPAEAIGGLVISIFWLIWLFVTGIGKKFGKNSDYDCLKRDNYQLDFHKFSHKHPDPGKYPYYLDDIYGNTYQCPVFLDYRNAEKGSILICVTLKNGQKYALLQKINLEK